MDCAGIRDDFHCDRCRVEAEHYRRGICARCALREDLTTLLIDNAADSSTMNRLVDAFCGVDAPNGTPNLPRNRGLNMQPKRAGSPLNRRYPSAKVAVLVLRLAARRHAEFGSDLCFGDNPTDAVVFGILLIFP